MDGRALLPFFISRDLGLGPSTSKRDFSERKKPLMERKSEKFNLLFLKEAWMDFHGIVIVRETFFSDKSRRKNLLGYFFCLIGRVFPRCWHCRPVEMLLKRHRGDRALPRAEAKTQRKKREEIGKEEREKRSPTPFLFFHSFSLESSFF